MDSRRVHVPKKWSSILHTATKIGLLIERDRIFDEGDKNMIDIKMKGSVILRKSATRVDGVVSKDEKLVIIFGIVKMPIDTEIETEKLLLTTGYVDDHDGSVNLSLGEGDEPNIKIGGYRVDQLLCLPIWKMW